MTPQAWIESAVQQLATSGPSFVSVHLDELGVVGGGWEEAAQALSQASSALPRKWAGRLSLALPLLETPSLCTSPPSDARGEANPSEPPSLYLLGPGHLEQHPTDGEAFHASVPAPTGLEDERLRFEFVSSRDAHAAERHWGFVNTLWIHIGLKWPR